MLKAINILKVLSVALFLIILTLVYAYMPIMVDLTPESGAPQIHKENFFYYAIGLFTLVNILLLGSQKLYEVKLPSVDVKAWARGLTFVINVYLTLLIGFLGVINNAAHLEASGFQYLNYLGPFFIFSWIIGFIYLLTRKSQTT